MPLTPDVIERLQTLPLADFLSELNERYEGLRLAHELVREQGQLLREYKELAVGRLKAERGRAAVDAAGHAWRAHVDGKGIERIPLGGAAAVAGPGSKAKGGEP